MRLTRDGLFLFKTNFLLSISFVEFLRRENLKFEAYEIKKFRNFASFKREFFFFFGERRKLILHGKCIQTSIMGTAGSVSVLIPEVISESSISVFKDRRTLPRYKGRAEKHLPKQVFLSVFPIP